MSDYALYMDDGGHPDDKPYVTVGGYIGSEDQWLSFEPKWKHKVAYFGIDYPFHMTDFMRMPLTDLKRDWILGTLNSIVKGHTSGKFGAAIKMDSYRKVNEVYPLQEMIGAPLAINAREIARQVNQWKRENFKDGDRLLVFMERGSKHFGDVLKVFKRDRLPTPIPVDKELAAVQPSDILAWEMLRYFRTGILSKNAKRIGQVKRQNFGGLFEEKQLIEICENAKVPLRSRISPSAKIKFHSEPKQPRHRTIK
jgi:hypothetical protein